MDYFTFGTQTGSLKIPFLTNTYRGEMISEGVFSRFFFFFFLQFSFNFMILNIPELHKYKNPFSNNISPRYVVSSNMNGCKLEGGYASWQSYKFHIYTPTLWTVNDVTGKDPYSFCGGISPRKTPQKVLIEIAGVFPGEMPLQEL